MFFFVFLLLSNKSFGMAFSEKSFIAIVITEEQIIAGSVASLACSIVSYGMALTYHWISNHPQYASSIYKEAKYDDKKIQEFYKKDCKRYLSGGNLFLGISGVLFYSVYNEKILSTIQDKLLGTVLTKFKNLFRN